MELHQRDVGYKFGNVSRRRPCNEKRQVDEKLKGSKPASIASIEVIFCVSQPVRTIHRYPFGEFGVVLG